MKLQNILEELFHYFLLFLRPLYPTEEVEMESVMGNDAELTLSKVEELTVRHIHSHKVTNTIRSINMYIDNIKKKIKKNVPQYIGIKIK